ncbi:MAG TPA: universal stress protein, partial [Chitinophagales bacterium]|nr:universal stress protein [Chitinophagales bacterium]
NIEKVLEFLILIKDKKSVHPISVLSVVSNDAEAEINILKSKNKLEEYVRQASAFEAKVNIITTIDHNPSSGISRIAREIMADIIMLGWPRQYGFVDKIFGKKLDNLLRSSDKTIFVGHLEKPLALLKRIVIIVPPLAEFENGFTLWVMKMAKLAQELSIPMVVYSNETSKIAVEKVFSKEKLSAKLYTYLFIDWDDFLVLSKYIQEEDLLVLVSARKGTTSYMRILETIPLKFEKYFAINSRLVIYPQEYDTAIIERFEDISGEPLDRGIEAVQKIGKGIGSIFKGNDQS